MSQKSRGNDRPSLFVFLTAFTWETSNAVSGLGANWNLAKHAAGVPAIILQLPVETSARDPTYRLGLYVHISKRLLRLYRFVPRSGMNNFPGYICLTGGGGFQDFPLGPGRQMLGHDVTLATSYLSSYGRIVVCYSCLLCHLRNPQH